MDAVWITGKGRSNHSSPDEGVEFKLISPEMDGMSDSSLAKQAILQ
jgi:hypothetical protein